MRVMDRKIPRRIMTFSPAMGSASVQIARVSRQVERSQSDSGIRISRARSWSRMTTTAQRRPTAQPLTVATAAPSAPSLGNGP